MTSVEPVQIFLEVISTLAPYQLVNYIQKCLKIPWTYPKNWDLLYLSLKFSLGKFEKCSLVAVIMATDAVMEGKSE